jgi:hypothetical protein
MVEFEFPNKSPAEANVLARELRMALLHKGVAESDVWISKERHTMDAGGVLHFTLVGLEALALAKLVWEVCVPARSNLRIKTAKGIVDIRSPDLEPDFLQRIVSAVSKDGPQS